MNRTNFSFLNQLNLDKDVESSLSRHLGQIVRGNETVLVSPITMNTPPDVLLSEWDKVFHSSKEFMSKDLLDLEATNRSKFGPRSIAIPWKERRGGVYDYFSGESSKVSSILMEANPYSGLATHRLRPLSIDSAAKFLKSNTNSGLPYFTRKGQVKDKYCDRLDDFVNFYAGKYPCVMFTRTQEQKKTRCVWGYPMADTLFEMKYYRPLLDYQKKLSWRSALSGPDSTNRKITEIITQAYFLNQQLLSLDFSTYDSTVKSSLQKDAFDYIKRLFQPHCEPELDAIAYRFLNIGLVTPDGVLTGEHGVPSGSTFTNEGDSIVQGNALLRYGLTENQFDVQGDDAGLRTSEPDKIKDYLSSLGLKVNDDKSYVRSGSLVYLQNLFDVSHSKPDSLICGIYPTYRALNRIIYLERYNNFQEDEISGSDYFSIRTIAILENCKHHPLFKDLVKFILFRDKYKLNFSENGLNNYVKRVVKSKGSEGIIVNQYEDNVAGILNFETVKIIRELDPR
jgi:hypothetical protein